MVLWILFPCLGLWQSNDSSFPRYFLLPRCVIRARTAAQEVVCLGSTWCGTGPQGDMRTDLEQCDPEDCASVMEFAGRRGLELYTSVIDPSKVGPNGRCTFLPPLEICRRFIVNARRCISLLQNALFQTS